MEHIAVLVVSSPVTPAGRRAFQLVRDLAAQGHEMTLGLLEDGVFGAFSGVPGGPLQQCAGVMVLADDLALRGVGAADLHPECRVCTYGEIIEHVMMRSDRILGAF